MSEDNPHNPKPDHQLRIILDPTGRKMGERLYEEYIDQGREDYSRLPEFMIALDRLLGEFGGRKMPDDDEDDDRPAKRPMGYDNSYNDDDDIHEAARFGSIKTAIAKVLKNK